MHSRYILVTPWALQIRKLPATMAIIRGAVRPLTLGKLVMATGEELQPSEALGCRGGRTASDDGLDRSWMVVNKREDGELVDGQDSVDLLDRLLAPESAAKEGGCAVDFNEERTSAGIGTMQTYDCQDGDGQQQQGVGPPNYDSQRDCAAVAPVLEYRVGSLVEVQNYGHGVVRWIGEVGGERMAGIELVCVRELLPRPHHEGFSLSPGQG